HRPRATSPLGCGGADAGEHARPLRAFDPRSRGRDLLLRLRRSVGPRSCACRAARRPRSLSRRRGGLVPKGKGGEMKSKWVWALVLSVVGVAVYGGLALATPPSGV